ncbi:MAG: CRISPR-associated ring nuclease Csm6 [Roseococcus sp.]|nr:CRISPR-associated ring nuclease Csm6 [Roseococcus sp.]
MSRPLHLLALAGLSPQVVTETVWCLAQGPARRLPQRITVLTTAAGRAAGEPALPEALRALGRQLGAALPDPEWRLLDSPCGRTLEDIVTEADNRLAADAIFAAVQEATRDEGVDVHLSIAGGRKTMGALATLALSLCGREGDVLSHVLVDPRLVGRSDFFFPPEPPVLLRLPGGGQLSTREAGLVLAEIPFVRLRDQWRPDRGAGAFAAAVAAAQRRLAPPRLVLEVAQRQALLGERRLSLAPALFAALLWLAERARAGASPLVWRGEEAQCFAGAYLGALARVAEAGALGAARKALSQGMERDYLAEKVSRLNRAFREALGPAAEPFLIRSEGRRPLTGYRLALPPKAITIIEDARAR